MGNLPSRDQMETHADWHPPVDRKYTVDNLIHPHLEIKGVIVESTVILITRNGMGTADDTLQQLLFNKYIELLLQNERLPNALCFYTDGVKLVCEGSPALEGLRQLESKGVRLIICSTCLNYFELATKVNVGIVGGMSDILEAQMRAEKVITI